MNNLLFLLLLTTLAWGASFQLPAQDVNIIPRPQQVVVGEGGFTVDGGTPIRAGSESEAVARVLQDAIGERTGLRLAIGGDTGSRAPAVKFEVDETLGQEANRLIVSGEGIDILASGSAGWFYGVQSLLQLLPETDQSVESFQLPAVTIDDAPRFAWRAFMLDEGRFFKGAEQVKLLLDEMARLKMNVFHWHLVDDQGWRIEIKKYPLLTEIGSKRKSSQVGPLKWESPVQSAEPHEGFYTQEEIREIVAYAAARHITVVPEIEMPGHSSAAIAAYPWLGTAKQKIEVPIRFGVSQDVYDVSDPRVVRFLTDVLDEVIELFPSKVIHIGGDEVKYDHWKSSPAVRKYMAEHGLDTPADLQVFFTNNISQYLESKGRRMMGWNEIMGHNLHDYQDAADTESDQELASSTVVHFWKGDPALATHAAENGFEIVNSLHSRTYLDYSYESIPLSEAYAFDPVPEGLAPQYHDNIIGTGCQMWGEWIPTDGQMHFQVFPRIAAYAEVGWTRKENKDFTAFKAALPALQQRWQRKGIYYAPDTVVERQGGGD
ncbi:hexosaminidase [Lewinella marina]|uniref:beta-N-acetylhexosaminidase n=1 Tax=Neolewinella marina TaxID=438751 RepID=A0A2G0CKI1_9BACT|nr:beta-N-acetylhexosaminidase [Neolewinella marina]NJB84320.1 hexosaminidase [Neolewinella marina]PHL00479.1 glycoside hydrolase family 20 [Neolewinella marina]